MEFRQLECFVTTAELGSMHRAAEALFTSQSSVSKHVSMLEEELGKQLFLRTNRGVRLTDVGREIYHHACGILQNIRTIKEMDSTAPRRRISIACYPSTSDLASVLLYNAVNAAEYHMAFREGTVREIINCVDDDTRTWASCTFRWSSAGTRASPQARNSNM